VSPSFRVGSDVRTIGASRALPPVCIFPLVPWDLPGHFFRPCAARRVGSGWFSFGHPGDVLDQQMRRRSVFHFVGCFFFFLILLLALPFLQSAFAGVSVSCRPQPAVYFLDRL